MRQSERTWKIARKAGTQRDAGERESPGKEVPRVRRRRLDLLCNWSSLVKLRLRMVRARPIDES